MEQTAQIRFVSRLLIYVGVWLGAVLAAEAFLPMEGATETARTEIQQRLLLPLETPLIGVFGLAEAFCWPNDIPSNPAILSAACIWIVQAFAALSCARRVHFIGLITLQTLLFGTALIYCIRMTHLPSGG